MELLTKIVLRNDSTQNWLLSGDKVLQRGEPAFEFLDDGTVKMKVGDGASTWNELAYFGGDVPAEMVEQVKEQVAALEKEVEAIQEIVTPTGEGSVPLLERIEAIENAVNGEGEGSVDAKIDNKIEEFATALTDDGKVNTLMELISYVEEHGEEAAELTASVSNLQTLVGTKSVAEQINDAKAEVRKLFKHVRYEISSKPAGTLVSYRDKEVRVMCPADTAWTPQTSGENADPNSYYVGLKAYAPDGAVSFKEDLAEIIADAQMYYFEDNDFAGTDELGRKYSIVWLPVARFDGAAWTYYGASSSKDKYIGWYYTVEWYDANGKLIESDSIRVNLSNENCHNKVEPYYMAGVVKEISVNGEKVDVVGGQANITLNNMIKDSEEIVVNEDGSLSIATVSIGKLVNDEEASLIISGGGAA